MADLAPPIRTEPPARPAWLEMADLLCEEGLTGHTLLATLRARFPTMTRDDVYRAIATAWTCQQASWLIDRIRADEIQP